jgi:ketosteroid isomerase-like protein
MIGERTPPYRWTHRIHVQYIRRSRVGCRGRRTRRPASPLRTISSVIRDERPHHHAARHAFSGGIDSFMPETKYAIFEALNPFFEIIQKGLTGLVDGEHYFDTVADDAFFDFRYRFPGWPETIRGRANLMAQFSGYGDNIRLHSADGLVVHHAQDRRVVILEYEVHGKILSTGIPYDNRLISVVTIKDRKIVHWRDYMDSLAAWTALNGTP